MGVKPILFNTEMVKAILEGHKTVTRRVVKFRKGQNPAWTGYIPDGAVLYGSNNIPAAKAPFRPGDILWVRETFRVDYLSNIPGCGRVQYKDGTYLDIRFSRERYDMMRRAQRKPGWRPNENMPREAARIFLRVTDVRVERLQDMHLIDCRKEGVQLNFIEESDLVIQGLRARKRFAGVWDSTIKPADMPIYGWDANPWVWVIEFDRIDDPTGGSNNDN